MRKLLVQPGIRGFLIECISRSNPVIEICRVVYREPLASPLFSVRRIFSYSAGFLVCGAATLRTNDVEVDVPR